MEEECKINRFGQNSLSPCCNAPMVGTVIDRKLSEIKCYECKKDITGEDVQSQNTSFRIFSNRKKMDIKCSNCYFMQDAESNFGICDKFSELRLLTENNSQDDDELPTNEMKASVGVVDTELNGYDDYDESRNQRYIPQLTVYVGHDFFCGNFNDKKTAPKDEK